MSQKIPQSSALDPSELDPPPGRRQADRPATAALGRRSEAECGRRNGETASSSPESGSLNGDGKRGGKSRRRRRKKRSADPESRPDGNADVNAAAEEKPDERAGRPPAALLGLRSECAHVWLERSVYERAESLYQCWLTGSSHGAAKSNRSPPAPGKNSPSAAGSACRRVVRAPAVGQAGRRRVEESAPPSVPTSLDPPSHAVASRTPDEGCRSLAPTPATPVVRRASAPPTGRRALGGPPRLPLELLRDVWLEKPLYDRAEAAFYQNMYGNNSSKRSSCSSTSRSTDHPQSLVEEEEEEEEEEDEELAAEEKRVVPQGKAEVFHALLPIQEEEEPPEAPVKDDVSGAGTCYFIHPDSERVWLDKWRYDGAESRFHGYNERKAVVRKKGRRPEAAAASTGPPRDKYDPSGRMESLQMFTQI